MAVALNNWQFDLNDFIFGAETDVLVRAFSASKAGSRTDEYEIPGGDGIWFGPLYWNGMTLDWELDFEGTDDEEVLNRLEDARQAWTEWQNRLTEANAVVPVRLKRPGRPTMVVYGQPRNFAEASLENVGSGFVQAKATFKTADHLFYSDNVDALTIDAYAIENKRLENLILNPSFEEDVDPWNPINSTFSRVTNVARFGGSSAELAPDGSGNTEIRVYSNKILVDGGSPYTGSFYARKPDTSTATAIVHIRWLEDGGGFTEALSPEVTLDTTWQRVTYTTTAPDGAVEAYFNIRSGGGTTTSDVMHTDGIMFTETSEAFDYFDGSFDGAYWTGSAHDSSSIRISGGFVWEVTWPIDWRDSFPESNIIENKGRSSAYPVITFYGPRTKPELNFVGQNMSVGIDRKILRDETITIDPRPWKRTITNQDGGSVAGDYKGPSLDRLKIPVGSSEVALRGEDRTGRSGARVEWQSTYTGI